MEAFQLAIPDERPRRLLHVASMTSTERVPRNVQGHDTQNAIFQYTWGTYDVRESPRLQVEGRDWVITAVISDHFVMADWSGFLPMSGLGMSTDG